MTDKLGAQKQRNYNVDDQLNRNWYKLLPRLRRARGGKEEGHFVTLDDAGGRRAVFIGGPGQGSATVWYVGPSMQPGPPRSFREAVASGEVVSENDLGGGITKPVLLGYKDDGSGVWKPLKAWDHRGNMWSGHMGESEAAAYNLAQLLEVPVGEVYFTEYRDEMGTVTEFIEGSSLADIRDNPDLEMDVEEELRTADPETLMRILALDVIIGNNDRHEGNLVVGEGWPSTIYAIDHGHATWEPYSHTTFSFSVVAGYFHDDDDDTLFTQDFAYIPFYDSVLDSLRAITLEDLGAALEPVGGYWGGAGKQVIVNNAWGNIQYMLTNRGIIIDSDSYQLGDLPTGYELPQSKGLKGPGRWVTLDAGTDRQRRVFLSRPGGTRPPVVTEDAKREDVDGYCFVT